MAGEIAEKAAKKALEKAPSWVERMLIPSLNEMKGELKAIHTRIDSLESNMNTRIGSLDERMNTRITSLETKMDIKFEGLDYRFETINTKLDSLEKRIPVIEA